MAHRNIKITRDLIQTCTKLRNKPKFSTSPFHNTAEISENLLSNEKNVMKEVYSDVGSTLEGTQNHTITVKGFTSDVANGEIKNLSPLLTTTRCYSRKHKRGGEEDCKPVEKKCRKPGQCPKFVMECCPPRKTPPNCKRMYIDVNCSKKMAPYPSYSELCAFRLEEDPSECMQCPWQRCGGVDDIKPQKKGYHTSTRPMSTTVTPSQSAPFAVPYLASMECDASKEPCKEPPPKCKKPEEKKEKCPEKKKKKCDQSDSPPSEAWVISGSMKLLEMQKYAYELLELNKMMGKPDPPVNIIDHLVYRMKGGCPKKHRKCPTINRQINHQFAVARLDHLLSSFEGPSTVVDKFVHSLKKDCPKDKPGCPPKRIIPVPVDRSFDNPLYMLAKEHDKGHPPPCPEKPKHPSKDCPEDADKKPEYRKERDLFDAYYRRPPKPYTPDNTN